MKYFAGIVPPLHIYRKLLEIQQQFGGNRLEPHITLRPPVSPLDAEAWVNIVTETASNFQPFDIKLPCTGYFGKRVLFVSVNSTRLGLLHDLLIPALKPFETPEVNKGPEGFHPHLTLGRAWCGFTPENFIQMQQLADAYLSASPVSFEATHVRIYHKPDHHGRYQPYKDVSLGK
ncbi:2'-5' RNA ligase family protein [Mucilaginibacter sp. PAMB04168]|uniref:2'-5' RNA ligase family protein n=1 Tax=Mucilaginibacter sp. PAMB04168 TaxID=3138567 RepID=UPI0031F6E57C